jgi:hypothetical protein
MDEKTMHQDSVDTKYPIDTTSEEASVGSAELIYIDPVKEAACRAKFDKYVLPVTFIFMILAVLDRNNVSTDTCSLELPH